MRKQIRQPPQRTVSQTRPMREQMPQQMRITPVQTPMQVSAMETPVKTWRYLIKSQQKATPLQTQLMHEQTPKSQRTTPARTGKQGLATRQVFRCLDQARDSLPLVAAHPLERT
jgi:hypothetical protein